MRTRFEAETAVRPVGDGLWEAGFTREWRIVRGPNGGTVAAPLLRAMAAAVNDEERSPRSFTIHYARPPAEGPVMIRTTVERTGRRLSTASARMTQDDKLIALALAAFSPPWEGIEFQELEMPEVPAPEDIEPRPDRGEMPFLLNFDFRWALGVQELASGGRAESGAWMRLREPQVVDPVVALQLTDAWVPAIFAKVIPPSGGVPTIDLTVHFRASLPPPGARPDDWVLGVFRTSTAHEGFLEEDGELWSRDGRLLAQSRQLAILL